MDEIIEENVAKQTAYLLGEQSGIEQGIEKGIEQNKKEVVINMYNKKYSVEEINEITQLPLDKIKKIIMEIE